MKPGREPVRARLRRLAPGLLWMAVLFGASSLHGDPNATPGRFPHVDKLQHFGAYAVLGALLHPAVAPWAPLVGTIYGATDELHQMFVPGRDASFGDLAADAAGSLAGAWLVARWQRRRPKSAA